jgi:hypothetical protein
MRANPAEATLRLSGCYDPCLDEASLPRGEEATDVVAIGKPFHFEEGGAHGHPE